MSSTTKNDNDLRGQAKGVTTKQNEQRNDTKIDPLVLWHNLAKSTLAAVQTKRTFKRGAK